MRENKVYVAYAQSLAWSALLIAVAFGVSIIVELIFVDLIHGNPNRTKAHAMLMMIIFPPIVGFIAVVGWFLTFTLPQCLQAIVSDVLVRQLGRRGQIGVLLALPLAATLAWYCYDYLTPSDINLGIYTPADWTPFEHGLTLQRYLTMLMVQAPITLFSLAYCDAAMRNSSKKRVVVVAVVLVAVVGVLHGHWMAEGQYQFL
jgi:hypothetical protein